MGVCSKGYKHNHFLIPARKPAPPLLAVVVQRGNNYKIPFILSLEVQFAVCPCKDTNNPCVQRERVNF